MADVFEYTDDFNDTFKVRTVPSGLSFVVIPDDNEGMSETVRVRTEDRDKVKALRDVLTEWLEPKLPTANGSRIRQARMDYGADELVEAILVGGVWVRADEAPDRTTERLRPEVWESGWVLVHNAGA